MMAGAQATACPSSPSLFHNIIPPGPPNTNRLTASVSILCANTFVTGPGPIYTLKFKASNTPQVTMNNFLPDVPPGLKLYKAGLNVTPVTSTNATITIVPNVPVELSRFVIE